LLGHSFPSLARRQCRAWPQASRKAAVHVTWRWSSRRLAASRWIAIAGDPIIDTAGRFEGFRGVGSDITEIRQTQETLTHLANMDVLSGLPNRGRVRQLLGEACAPRPRKPCLRGLFLDLDGFKPVNDTFGHPKGDAVLRAVAKRLVDEVGAGGHVGRMGGDEFAVVIPDAQSRKRSSRWRSGSSIRSSSRTISTAPGSRSACRSAVRFRTDRRATVDDLILKADLALYEAKGAGRGIARYFSSELQSEKDDRVRMEADLRAALPGKQFHLVFQPLIAAKTQKLVGFEALIRWNHPTRGLVPPNVFIPVAEDIGVMPAIGEWVIEEACRAAATWPENISVSLNVSPKQIVLPSLPNTVSEALARHRVQGNRIELEVTEGVFLGDNGPTLDVLGRLRRSASESRLTTSAPAIRRSAI
jgi:diguanylate cyclase (GGDEF)-like protein